MNRISKKVNHPIGPVSETPFGPVFPAQRVPRPIAELILFRLGVLVIATQLNHLRIVRSSGFDGKLPASGGFHRLFGVP